MTILELVPHTHSQLMKIHGENPPIGQPTIDATIPDYESVWTKSFRLGEGESVDCSAYRGNYGFTATCWREKDSGDKNLWIEIKKAPLGCKDGASGDCEGLEQSVIDRCNA